jgi:signal transduction histidine kinase/ligand-binding sensor domain-containing protein
VCARRTGRPRSRAPRRATLALLGTLTLSGLTRPAQADGGDTPTFVVTRWSDAPNLPLPEVSALARTPDGFLWLGTKGGLVRFDGASFRRESVPGLEATAQRWIYDLGVDGRGTLWAGTKAAEGLLAHRDGRWHAPVHGPALGHVRVLRATPDGSLWVGSERGLFALHGERLEPLVSAEALGGYVEALAPAVDGGLWVGSNAGVFHYRPDQTPRARPLEATGAAPTHVLSLLEDDDGLWIGTAAGLHHRRGGSVTAVPVTAGLPTARVYALARDRRGTLWVGTRAGLYRRQGDRFEPGALDRTGATGTIWELREDEEGTLWVGSKAGLLRLRPALFGAVPWPVGPGRPPGASTAILVDGGGGVWAGTAGQGLARLEEGGWRFFRRADGLCTESVLALGPSRDGGLWVGGGPDGPARVCRFHDGRFLPEDTRALADGELVRTLHEDRQGRLWVGGRRLYVRSVAGAPLAPVALPGARDSVHFVVERIKETEDGHLWIATREGLWRRDGETFRRDPPSGPGAYPWIYDIVSDDRGGHYLTGDRGFARLAAGRVTPFMGAQGFVDTEVFGLARVAGRLWLSTSNGVVAVREAQVMALEAGEIPHLPYRRFGSADGLAADVIGAGGTPPLAVAPDGRVWFSTAAGPSALDPGRAPDAESAPPRVFIEKVAVNGTPAATERRLAVPRGAGALQVEYTAPALVDPSALRFRYRLEPVEARWTDAGPERLARYTGLPAGRYRFVVAAAWGAGAFGSDTAFAFELQPRLFETGAFRATALALVALLLFGLHRARTWRLRAQHAAVLAERTRIARELHDTLAQAVGAIAFRLEGARMSPALPDSERRAIDRAWQLARSTLAEARQAIWRLRHEAAAHEDLGTALRGLVASTGRALPVEVRLTGTPRPVPEGIRFALLRIAQEALANASRYADARTIRVDLDQGADAVALRVSDDGAGLSEDAATAPGHYGITGMRERAEEVGGTFTLTSAPGRGTTVAVRVPLPPFTTAETEGPP